MKKICNNNGEINYKKKKLDEFDNFLKSLLNHNKSQLKLHKNRVISKSNNKILLTLDNNKNNINNKINLKSSNKNNINDFSKEEYEINNKINKKTRNKELLYSTFSNKNFITLDQLIEIKNKKINNFNNIKIKNKYNSISNKSPNEIKKKLNKTSEIYSNYNLLLIDKLNNIHNMNINNINPKKRNNKNFKSKENLNLNYKKLFKTFDNNIAPNNNYNPKDIEKTDIKINEKKNKFNRNQTPFEYKNKEIDNNNNDINYINDIKIKRKKIFDLNKNKKNNNSKNYTNIKLNKLNEENNDKNKTADISTYNIRNYSFPNDINIINYKNMKRNNKNVRNFNKSNITMNNNYIFNNIQNKYNLSNEENYKINNNPFSILHNKNNLNNIEKDKNKEVFKNNYNINKKFSKINNDKINYKNNYKIIKVSSFYFINNIKLSDVKRPNIKIFILFKKMINIYKNLLLKEKKKEKLLLNKINEKNNEIKSLKNAFLKIFCFFEKEMININLKRILIEKQLIEENKYLRNLTISKNNIYSNFYSPNDTSYEGFLVMFEKSFSNNNNLKNKIKNSKNETANNSPQITKRKSNEDLLFINGKKKLFKNCYILKKNRKEIL